MVISTEINSFKKYGNIEEILKMLKESGFEAYDFSMFDLESEMYNRCIKQDDYIEEAKRIRIYADAIGLPCNQTHAPEPTYRRGNETYNREMFQKLIRAIEVSGILGAKVCVVHPNCLCDDPYTQNFKFYNELLPYARKAGVKIAVENMWDWDDNLGHATPTSCSTHTDFKGLLELFGEEKNICACLDIGHAEMKGLETNGVLMIKALDKHIQALHIHDNDKHNDLHQLPFMIQVDYEKIISALAEIRYSGDVTLEAGSFVHNVPISLYPQTAWYMAEIAKYIREEICKRTAKQ